MEFKMCSLPASGKSIISNANTTVQSDIIVPDTKPDIFKVLAVKSVVDLADSHIKKDKINFSGKIRHNILYVGEENPTNICTIEYSTPFGCVCEKNGITEDTAIKYGCGVTKSLCEVVNSRKISVEANVEIQINAIDISKTEVISGEEIPESLAYKSCEYSYDTLRASNRLEFVVSDTVDIGAGEGFEIYDIQAYNEVSEIKAVNNKAVIKGIVNVFILYNDDGKISGYSTEIPYTEIVDIENLASDQTLISHFEISSVDYELPNDDDTVQMTVSIVIRGNIWGYAEESNTIATDIYSPDYAYDIRLNKCILSKVSDVKETRISVKDTLVSTNPSSPISKVYCAWSDITKMESHISDGVVKIEGTMESTAIYCDEYDNLHSAKGVTPFETEIEFSFADKSCQALADASVISSGFVMTSTSDIQIRTVIKLSSAIVSDAETQTITSFSLDEKSSVKKDEQPSILVYYPDDSKTLWDIAKKYNTTCEEIIDVNSLDKDNPIIPGVPVLIPKRYVK